MTGNPVGSTADLQARWDASILGTYGTPALALVRGAGCEVWDADGRRYLDLLAGIAVNALGHGHPAIIEAVGRQLATLGHTSNLYITEPGVALAERLLGLLDAIGPGRVFFANSGTEANEAAVKIARRHGAEHGGRDELIAAHDAFHGRTLGALAITGNADKREPFAPLPGPVTFVPYGDIEALRSRLSHRTAAVFLEPVLGEAGVIPPPAGYLTAARRACDDAGALLVLDEVQGGIGRTGAWFAFQHEPGPVRPDVVTLAKGLAGGLPIGACVALTEAAATSLRRGQHGSTFGGNPVSAAAAMAVLDTIETAGLLTSVQAVGEHLASGLRGLDHPLLDQVVGRGLWLGMVLTAPVAAQVEAAARAAGFLVNGAASGRVRLAPPLVFSESQADEFLAAAPAILDTALAAGKES
ncbi:MAG TPA: acetylornithine transaminase [Mycobacteriales bacterium]|nr:acetylornithine transaminase [Mycobacteriales bacterium]